MLDHLRLRIPVLPPYSKEYGDGTCVFTGDMMDLGLILNGRSVSRREDGSVRIGDLYAPYDDIGTDYSSMAVKFYHEARNCLPNLEIKASPNKLMQGHNVYGFESIRKGARHMLSKNPNTVNNPMHEQEKEQEQEKEIQENHENKNAQRRIYLLAQDLPKDYEIRRTEPMLQVRGIMQMKGKCLSYNAYGDVMTLSQADCKDYVGTGRVYRAEPSQNMSMTARGEPYTPSEPQPKTSPQAVQGGITSTDEYIFTDKFKSEPIFN